MRAPSFCFNKEKTEECSLLAARGKGSLRTALMAIRRGKREKTIPSTTMVKERSRFREHSTRRGQM